MSLSVSLLLKMPRGAAVAAAPRPASVRCSRKPLWRGLRAGRVPSWAASVLAVVATLIVGAGPLHAQTTFNLATWEIPVPFPTGSGLVPTGTAYVPPNQTGTSQWPTSGTPYPAGTPTTGVLAGISSAILSVFHTSTATSYTSVSGNGSPYSFSSNNWSPNDYYQVVLPTSGRTNLTLTWDQARSSTGPLSFALQMSTDGSSFTQLTTYSVLQSGGGGAPGTWVTGSYNPIYSNTFSLPGTADNQATLYLRFTNVTGSASASSGANRIDNISITTVPVPEPGTVAMLAAGGGILLAKGLRRRRRSPEGVKGRDAIHT